MAALAELVAGAGLLVRGLALLARRPRLFWLGALPPLITSVLLTGVLVLLISRLDAISVWLTPFATGWSPGVTQVTRMLVGLGVLTGSVLIMVLTFTALTLTLGAPLYDRISDYVDREFPDPPPAHDEPAVRGLARAGRQSVALIAASAAGALVFLLVGLVPVVGAVVAAIGSAGFGGWMVCLELVGSPLERRGVLTIAERRAVLRRSRARVLGLGLPTFLLLSLPFVGVVAFPVATAAGTLLARELTVLRPAGDRGPSSVTRQ